MWCDIYKINHKLRENIKPKNPEKQKEKKLINMNELEILKDLLLYKILRESSLSMLEKSILNSNSSKELSSNDLKKMLEKYSNEYTRPTFIFI